jgi:hypothetical protein
VSYAAGANYEVEVSRTLAFCRVWKRTDLTREEGMRCAEEKVRVFERLVAEPRLVVRALVFDLREAPPMWGPVTQECLERMVATFEQAERRIAVVVGNDAIQALQMKRIVKERAPTMGHVFTAIDVATDWVRERISSRVHTVPKS